MAHQNVDASARAAIRAQTQTAIGLNIPVFSGIKSYSINPEKQVQRVDNAIATGGWSNDHTIGFVSTAPQDSALKCYHALSSRDLDNKVWEVVKTQLIKSYGTEISTTGAYKGISKLYQRSKSVLDYFSEVSEVCKVLIKLFPKDYKTDLTFPKNIIQK